VDILIKKFIERENFGVVCENMEEVKLFCKIMDENRITWYDNERYSENNGISLLRSCCFDDQEVFPCVYYSDRTIDFLENYVEDYGDLIYLKNIGNRYCVELI